MSLKKYSLIILILISINCFSQPGPPSPGCWPPPCVPVDGGIGIFTLISILLGYKFLSKNK